jgi:hypothetical protein
MSGEAEFKVYNINRARRLKQKPWDEAAPLPSWCAWS